MIQQGGEILEIKADTTTIITPVRQSNGDCAMTSSPEMVGAVLHHFCPVMNFQNYSVLLQNFITNQAV